MRLRKRDLRTIYVRECIRKKDKEASTYIEYGEASELQAHVWQAGGELQTRMYGQKVKNIRNALIDGEYTSINVSLTPSSKIKYSINGALIGEGDGVCVDVPGTADPDYKIISINPEAVLSLELEKI